MTYGTQLELEGLMLDIWYDHLLRVTHINARVGLHTDIDMKLDDFDAHMKERIADAVQEDFSDRDESTDNPDAYYESFGELV